MLLSLTQLTTRSDSLLHLRILLWHVISYVALQCGPLAFVAQKHCLFSVGGSWFLSSGMWLLRKCVPTLGMGCTRNFGCQVFCSSGVAFLFFPSQPPLPFFGVSLSQGFHFTSTESLVSVWDLAQGAHDWVTYWKPSGGSSAFLSQQSTIDKENW